MKFLKENWYKLMTGTAMLIFACGFFIYAVSPSYANQTSEVNKPQMESNDDGFAVVTNGYLVMWPSRHKMWDWVSDTQPYSSSYNPKVRRIP